MTNRNLISAKATSSDEQSDSVVVSFESDWEQPLLSNAVSVVIRKRIPKNTSFKWLYFHINSPVSSICGRAKIQRIFSASTKEAVAIAKQIGLSPTQISTYIGAARCIGCYKLGTVQCGTGPIPLAKLTTRLAYYPPQSFVILSKQAKRVIDQMAGFSSPQSGRREKAASL